jgi:hypothetical protein
MQFYFKKLYSSLKQFNKTPVFMYQFCMFGIDVLYYKNFIIIIIIKMF